VQEVLFWVWQRRGQWEVREGRLATYLYTAVRNRARNDARNRRRVDRWTPVAPFDLRLAGRGPEPVAIDDAIVRAETGQAVWQAVAALPARRREVVILRWYNDLPYADIAQVLGLSVKTVETTLRKALRSLRQTLDRRP
jgi:RNA polymerase sigma-70 factor (ECF subfamily)